MTPKSNAAVSDKIAAATTAEQNMKGPANHPTGDEVFFQAVQANNPFERNRLSNPSQMDCNVSTINANAFDQLTQRADEALSSYIRSHQKKEAPQGRGAMLFGAAGTGKSHLLARFSHWAAERKSCFVYLYNIQVRPLGMSRYLLNSCVTLLADGQSDNLEHTQVFQIVDRVIRDSLKRNGITKLNNKTFGEAMKIVANDLLHREPTVTSQGKSDEKVLGVVFRFFCCVNQFLREKAPVTREKLAKQASIAIRYLRGDVIDKVDALELRLETHDKTLTYSLLDEEIPSVFRVLGALTAQCNRHFIVCVDQVDNMTKEQIAALTRIARAYLDSVGNLFVVVSGVGQELRHHLQVGTITTAQADALNSARPIEIHQIKPDDAKQLLQERLNVSFGDLFAAADQCEPFVRNDKLFPLGESWFDQTVGNLVEVRPRDVLTYASDRWRVIQRQLRENGGPDWLNHWQGDFEPEDETPPTPEECDQAIDQLVTDKLAEAITNRRLNPSSLPADEGNLLGLTRRLLEHCLHRPREYTLLKVESSPPKLKVGLVVREKVADKALTNVVQALVTGSKQKGTLRIRSLLLAPNADHRILITDEDRAPLVVGPKGREYLDDLKKLGPDVFVHVPLKFEQYAMLDALMSVVGEARSGDLEAEPKTGHLIAVSESQVIECHHRRERYKSHPLLRHFLTETAVVEPKHDKNYPPEDDFRCMIMGRLGLLMGANLSQLINEYGAKNGTLHNVASWAPPAKEIVLRMHEEQLVIAKPWNNDLYLTVGLKA